jgi:hypothetical protein
VRSSGNFLRCHETGARDRRRHAHAHSKVVAAATAGNPLRLTERGPIVVSPVHSQAYRPISEEEKRSAVRRVLESRALGRSDQLRNLLRYVCEAEIEGRADVLSEYLLGVEVLGRPPGYSPTEDSCVRSRAYELRSRLQIYYDSEAPDDPIRVIIDKGGYCPRFERTKAPPPPERAVANETPLRTSELEALWRPLLGGDAPLLIAFDVRLFFYAPGSGLVLRDHLVNSLAEAAHSEPLATFQRQMRTTELRETRDYADFGTVHAAFLLGRLLAQSRRDVVLKHSAMLDWQDVWNNNLVFIGKDNINPIVAALLEGKDFRTNERGRIENARPLAGELAEYSGGSTHGEGEKYALITRLRGPQAGRNLLLLSGPAAELMWALAESVTNPSHVAMLLCHLRSPLGQYPDQFQIVIRALFRANVPVEITYVTHHVFD